MKRFVSKKSIKVPRYKVCYILFVLVVCSLLLFKLVLNYTLNSSLQSVFLNVLYSNSWGITSLSLKSIIFQSVWGFTKEEETLVSSEDTQIVSLDVEKTVYIYSTFQTDKYKSNYFNSYNIVPYVSLAGLILKEYLEDYGILSLVEEEKIRTILNEEDIDYANIYTASRILLERRKAETPTLAYYFDLQVSDYAYEITTTTIDGVSMAKILFVVGTDNDTYQQNYVFATALNNILEDVCPELSRGVDLRGGSGYQGVYNQDFADTALLIQVGGVNNTIAEVNRSLQVLAEVIAKYIKEDSDAKES